MWSKRCTRALSSNGWFTPLCFGTFTVNVQCKQQILSYKAFIRKRIWVWVAWTVKMWLLWLVLWPLLLSWQSVALTMQRAQGIEKGQINPLKKTRTQAADRDLFSARVGAGPVGQVIYLCLVGKSTKNRNMNPYPDRICTSEPWDDYFFRNIVKKKKNLKNPIWIQMFRDYFQLGTSWIFTPQLLPLSSSVPQFQADELQLWHDLSRKHYLPAIEKHPPPLPWFQEKVNKKKV